ncbi:TPA: hypothetical protein ACU9T0_006553 [Burkholderia cenocepacia]
MKRAVLIILVVAVSTHAQTQWGIKSNQQLGGVQFTMKGDTKAARPMTAETKRCVFEAGLLAKMAQLRDLDVPEKETRAAIARDVQHEKSYSPEFVSASPALVTRIYAEGWKTPSDVRMAYLKQCDPKTFNWY